MRWASSIPVPAGLAGGWEEGPEQELGEAVDRAIQKDWMLTQNLKEKGGADTNALHSKIRLFLPSVQNHAKSRNDKLRFKKAKINS